MSCGGQARSHLDDGTPNPKYNANVGAINDAREPYGIPSTTAKQIFHEEIQRVKAERGLPPGGGTPEQQQEVEAQVRQSLPAVFAAYAEKQRQGDPSEGSSEQPTEYFSWAHAVFDNAVDEADSQDVALYDSARIEKGADVEDVVMKEQSSIGPGARVFRCRMAGESRVESGEVQDTKMSGKTLITETPTAASYVSNCTISGKAEIHGATVTGVDLRRGVIGPGGQVIDQDDVQTIIDPASRTEWTRYRVYVPGKLWTKARWAYASRGFNEAREVTKPVFYGPRPTARPTGSQRVTDVPWEDGNPVPERIKDMFGG